MSDKDLENLHNQVKTGCGCSCCECLQEYDLAEWLLNNKEGLEEKIASLYRPANHLFPPAMYEIYLEQYEEGVLKIIREELAFQLTPEELQTKITKTFIRKIVPELLKEKP